MNWKHRLEYVLLRAVIFTVGTLSTRAARRFGRSLGVFTYTVLRIRRQVTIENLAAAFPEWPRSRVEKTARDCYAHFGVTFVELVRLPGMSDDELRALMDLHGTEHLDNALRDGHGLVLCTGHFGNWEALGARVAIEKYPVWVAARTQRNLAADAYVTTAREEKGIGILRIEEGFRRMLRPLRNGEFMTLLFDQDAGRGGIFIDFLGRPASTAVGVARFARIARCPIVAVYAVRQEDGRYVAEFTPPVELRGDLSTEEAEKEMLERLVAQLETLVRRHPEQWFWMHRRWKTRPDGGAVAPKPAGVGEEVG